MAEGRSETKGRLVFGAPGDSEPTLSSWIACPYNGSHFCCGAAAATPRKLIIRRPAAAPRQQQMLVRWQAALGVPVGEPRFWMGGRGPRHPDTHRQGADVTTEPGCSPNREACCHDRTKEWFATLSKLRGAGLREPVQAGRRAAGSVVAECRSETKGWLVFGTPGDSEPPQVVGSPVHITDRASAAGRAAAAALPPSRR